MNINWSPRVDTRPPIGFSPPLPGTPGFSKVKGRSGDLIVIQVKSGDGRKANQQDCLRSLGLHGPRSAALRDSRDASTRGYIQTVKHLVSVIELEGIYFKDETRLMKGGEVEFDKPKYGTDSQPSQLFRDLKGDYFLYESSDRQLRVAWSTQDTLEKCLEDIVSLYPQVQESVERVFIGQESTQDVIVQEKVGSAAIDLVRSIGKATFFNMQLADDELYAVSWRQPYKRFHDRTSLRGEVSVSTPKNLSEYSVRQLVRQTCDNDFLDRSQCFVEVRNGRQHRQIKI